MTQHPSHPGAEALAAYAAGDPEGDDVGSHLATCAACAADLAAIERATRAVAALPPLRMPLDVVASLDRALTDEAMSAGAVSPDADSDDGPAPTSVDMAPSRRAARSRLLLPVSAAAAVAVLATVIGLNALRDDGSDGAANTAASGAGRTATVEPRLLHSGTDYTAAVLDFEVRDVLSAPPSAESAALADSASQPAPLAAGAAAPKAADTRQAAGPEMTPEQLQSCVDELSGAAGTQPLLVDFASYEKAPAVLVVLPFRDGKVDVFVVRPTCRLNNAELILFKRVTTN